MDELRSSNEQHQLSAEEAQAAAEEVETLNEELQATNEELNTTNEDLQNRGAELQEVSRAREQEQKQMHAQLQDQLRALLESVPEPMLVVEPSGHSTLTNEAYRNAFGERGCAADADAGAELSEEGMPQNRVTRGETFTTRIVAAGDDGTRRRYEVRGAPVGGEDQRGGLVVFRELPE